MKNRLQVRDNTQVCTAVVKEASQQLRLELHLPPRGAE